MGNLPLDPGERFEGSPRLRMRARLYEDGVEAQASGKSRQEGDIQLKACIRSSNLERRLRPMPWFGGLGSE